jgi:membrane associated rhomboid family serine protease/DNA-directed RNA polymerase subunit RPC12/RpoP
MPLSPDLFVVCKQCGAEVSPYITECPYCGSRLRSRAPKLPRVKSRGGLLRRLSRSLTFGRARSHAHARGGRRRQPRSGGLFALDTRPYATIALVALGCAGWVIVRGGFLDYTAVGDVLAPYRQVTSFLRLAIVGPLHGDWWKLLTSQFAYIDGLYAFVALLATALFGWLLERRRGPAIALLVFLGGGITGALVACAVYVEPVVSGANGAPHAQIAAWAVPDLQAARRGDYYEGDLLGTGAIAAVLLVVPYARPEASWLAGLVGAAFGLVAGVGLHTLDQREL